LANFYQTAIGLKVLGSSQNSFALGTLDGTVLLEIHRTDTPASENTTGLYHLAFLLPTYKDLGTILRHLIVNQIPMTGASDHGYSNALYLNDPEGNGIEIYWDKPEAEWDIREDGQIAGVTEPMDANSALEAASTSFDGMPNGTTMGHVHLHVDKLEDSEDFYTEVLGLGLKYKFGPAAIFLASGDYHHHLGINVWKPGQLEKPNRLAPGLRTVEWSGTEDDLKYIEDKLNEKNIEYTNTDGVLVFKDPAGIEHSVSVD
jgi:catechol 2,3-dioxygenase